MKTEEAASSRSLKHSLREKCPSPVESWTLKVYPFTNQQNKVQVRLEHKTLMTAKIKRPRYITTDTVLFFKLLAEQRTYQNIYKQRKCGLKYSNQNKYAWIWIIEIEPKSECNYKMAKCLDDSFWKNHV